MSTVTCKDHAAFSRKFVMTHDDLSCAKSSGSHPATHDGHIQGVKDPKDCWWEP